MKPLRFGAPFVFAVALSSSAAALERHDVLRRELQLGPGSERLVVVDNVMGGVEVRAGDGDRVTVEIRRRATSRRESELARAFDEVTLAVEEWSGGLALIQDGPFRCHGRRGGHAGGHDADERTESRDSTDARADRALGRSVGRSVGRAVGRAVGRSWGEWRREWRGDCDWDPDYELDWQWTVTVPADVDLEVSTVNDGVLVVDGVRGRVRASNVNGPLRLSGLAREVRAATVNGGIVARYAVAPAAEGSFRTVNGEIELELPAASSVDVELETMNGELWSDFDVRTVARESRAGRDGRTWRLESDTVVRIGDGGPRFECQTLNGDIVLRAR